MQHTLAGAPVSFRQFIWREHKDMLVIFSLSMAIVFIVYKIVYPFPSFMPDSYFYISMAYSKYTLVPDLWPVGYSWFLRTLHFVTASPYLFVLLQYLLLELCCLWLVFTLFYILQPPQWVKKIILLFLAVNPMFLYLTNQVCSDALFTALSFCWLAMLLQMIIRPRWYYAILQGILLAYIFTIRHQAMYYPILMIAALALTRYRWWWKGVSAAIGLLLIGGFVRTTRLVNEREIGIKIFSGFGGWQLANNAIYMYPYVNVDTSVFYHTSLEVIDRNVRTYLDTLGYTKHNLTPFDIPMFLLDYKGPLKHYQFVDLPAKSPHRDGLWYYHKSGDEFNTYGWKLIRAHPLGYIRYFLLPNIGGYTWPILEVFDRYNEDHTYVWPVAQQWFGLQNGVYCHWVWGGSYIMGACKGFFLALHLYLLLYGVMFFRKKKYLIYTLQQRKGLFLLTLAFGGNAFFSIIAAPVMFRYQIYGMILGCVLLVFLMFPFVHKPVPEPDSHKL